MFVQTTGEKMTNNELWIKITVSDYHILEIIIL